MLDYLAVKNLRSIGREQGINIKPLTVIMGKNSSGKSSILRAMFLLRQTAEARDPQTAAVFEGQYAQLGSFHDFAYKHAPNTEVGVTWGFRPDRPHRIPIPIPIRRELDQYDLVSRAAGAVLSSVSLAATFTYNRRTTEVRSESVAVDASLRSDIPEGPASDWCLRLERNRIDNTWSEFAYSSEAMGLGGSYKIQRTGKFYDLSIGRFHARQRRSGVYTQYLLRRIAAALAQYLDREAERLVLLGPLRTEARRFYLLTGERPEQIGLAGEKSIEVLWMAQRRGVAVTDFVQKWLKAFDISLNIKLRRLARTSFLAVELEDPRTNVAVQLADVGVGASQVLPILIGGFMSVPGTTLVIEQPELHLHPAAQAEMGDALIEMMRGERIVIIETHSEHLVRRIQRRIADGTLNEDKVAIYYTERTGRGTEIIRIPLDERGSFLSESLPEGFFDVDYRETTAMTSAWRAKRNV